MVQRVLEKFERQGDPVAKRVVDRLMDFIKERHSTFEAMLRQLDLNGNGTLDMHEIAHGLTLLGVELSAGELSSVMGVFDNDGNGSIEYEEFYALLTRHRINPRDVVLEAARVEAIRIEHLASHSNSIIEDSDDFLGDSDDGNNDGMLSSGGPHV